MGILDDNTAPIRCLCQGFGTPVFIEKNFFLTVRPVP